MVIVSSTGKVQKKKGWMPDWVSWITHGLIHFGCGVMFLLSGFSRKETAALLTAGMIWWVNREEEQDGIRSKDDYGDMIVPFLVTVGFWILAFVPEG